jgi:hypothetical protein
MQEIFTLVRVIICYRYPPGIGIRGLALHENGTIQFHGNRHSRSGVQEHIGRATIDDYNHCPSDLRECRKSSCRDPPKQNQCSELVLP